MVLLMSFGNPLRGDDGAGRKVASAALRGDAGLTNAVAWHDCQQLTPDLAADLAEPGVTSAVFVDTRVAVSPEDRPGLCALEPGAARVAGTHGLTPAGLLGLALRLYGRCPGGYLLTVPGWQFPHGEGLSRPCRAAAARATAVLGRLLADLAGTEAERHPTGSGWRVCGST